MEKVEYVHFNDITLENCPCCGGAAVFCRRTSPSPMRQDEVSISIYVMCGNCALSTMPMFTNDLAVRYPKRYKPLFPAAYSPFDEKAAALKAAELWNRRV